ncbi:hypothetical protein SVIOM342S_02110 [Streptomyces violaceorubidus]
MILGSSPKPGRWPATGVSSPSVPSATSCSTTVAVKVLVLLPIRTCPSTGGFALSPSLRTPALPAHSPRSSCTRSVTPVKPDSTISSMACWSSGRLWPAGVMDMVVCSFGTGHGIR